MSKQAKISARKFKKPAGAQRLIICEQTFDILDGDLTIAVYHPESKSSFAFIPEGLPAKKAKGYGLALRKAIWNEALKHIKTDSNRVPEEKTQAEQPGLF